jgi:Fe-S protein assembly co-chaperone HscB
MNFFEIFGLDVAYIINLDNLEKNYLNLQKKYHPDNFSDKSEVMKAASYIIDLNKGYNILKDNIKRAVYILELNNLYLDGDKKNYFPNKNLMTEIFNAQENGSVMAHQEINIMKQAMQNALDYNNINTFADLTMRLIYSKIS